MYERSAYELNMKREILRNVIGYRHMLTERLKGCSSKEPFVSLNTIIFAYDDAPEVLKELNRFQEDMMAQGFRAVYFSRLIAVMAIAANIDLSSISQDMIERPFTPNARTIDCL